MLRVPSRLLATVATAALTTGFASALVACGGGGGGGSLAGEPCPAKVDATVDAGPNGALRFAPSSLSAKSGKWVVKLVNQSSISHTFEIHGLSGEVAVNGDTKVRCATFDLTSGSFTFFCGINGHEGAGMHGKLTVSS
jgi:plastocyanin